MNASEIYLEVDSWRKMLEPLGVEVSVHTLYSAAGEVLLQADPQLLPALQQLARAREAEHQKQGRRLGFKVKFVSEGGPYRYETLAEPRGLGLASLLGAGASATAADGAVLALCEDPAVTQLGLASGESMGLGSGLGLGAEATELVRVLGRLAAGSGAGAAGWALLRRLLGGL